MIKSVEQARTFGKTLLLWCAQRATVEKILPDGMGAPQRRTLESWLEHGELSIVARRQKARYQNKYQRTDRAEQNPPWVVTMTLSNASTPTGGKLGKLVGAMALGFEMRDVPHRIRHKMQGNVRRWFNTKDKDDKKRKGSGQTLPSGNRANHGLSNAAWAMGGGVAGAGAGGEAASKRGNMPVGGWTREQQQQWDDEERARKARDAEMQIRVDNELEEIRRNPRVVPKKIVGAIKKMGVSPNRDVVDKLAAKVIAYRRQMGSKEGNNLFQDKAMSNAVRKKVEEYEARK
jgi:hypothetical protein